METIKEVKEHLKNVTDLDDEYLKTLADDGRAGVQTALKSKRRKLNLEKEKHILFEKRFTLEREQWGLGNQFVAGIDEVGRGCLAGPVVTAAVVIDESFSLVDVNDSKQLSAELRATLYSKILSEAVSVGIGVSSNQKIDKDGIIKATKDAMLEAIANLSMRPNHLLIDAVQVPSDIPKTVMFKGDSTSISIAAASIVAKVYRDQLMATYNQKYPGYGFDKNVGYGTKQHLDGLAQLGVTDLHRKTFEPVPQFLNK